MWLDILILSHLAKEPAHGYEIKQRVGRSIGHTTPLNNNVLYPALRRLEEMGAIEAEVVPQQGTPARRVYRLTEGGMEALQGLLRDFPPELALNDGEFNTRLAYFHLLEPEARLEILRARAGAGRALLDHLRRALAEELAGGPYVPRLLRFLIQQQESDVRFVEELAAQEARQGGAS